MFAFPGISEAVVVQIFVSEVEWDYVDAFASDIVVMKQEEMQGFGGPEPGGDSGSAIDLDANGPAG